MAAVGLNLPYHINYMLTSHLKYVIFHDLWVKEFNFTIRNVIGAMHA